MKQRYKNILSAIATLIIVVGVGVYVLEGTMDRTNRAEQVCNDHNGDLISGQHYHCSLENGTKWHIVSAGPGNQYVVAEPNDIETCHNNGLLGCDNHFFTFLGIGMSIGIFIALIIISSIIGPRRVNHR